MRQIQQVLRLIDDTLGADTVGVYLHGSAVSGGLKPASDLDLLVVTAHTMNDRQRRALLAGLLPISGPGPGSRSLEVSVVVQSEVRPWRYPPIRDFQYGDWLRDEFEAGAVPRPQPTPDLALLISVALAGDHPLAGPPPAQVFDPVPPADVVRASVAGIPGLLADLPTDTRNVVLTLARIWVTLATREILPKDAAADWALDRLPPRHRPVLEYAKHLYLCRTYSEETWSEELRAQVRPHVDAVLAEIDGLRSRSGAPSQP